MCGPLYIQIDLNRGGGDRQEKSSTLLLLLIVAFTNKNTRHCPDRLKLNYVMRDTVCPQFATWSSRLKTHIVPTVIAYYPIDRKRANILDKEELSQNVEYSFHRCNLTRLHLSFSLLCPQRWPTLLSDYHFRWFFEGGNEWNGIKSLFLKIFLSYLCHTWYQAHAWKLLFIEDLYRYFIWFFGWWFDFFVFI